MIETQRTARPAASQAGNTSRTAEPGTNIRAARSGRPYLAGDWEGQQRADLARWELFPSLSV